MKQIIKYASLLTALVAAAVGCNKDPEMYELRAPQDQMHVAASEESVVVSTENIDDDVITFTWDQAYSHGSNYSLEYNVVMKHSTLPDQFHTEHIKVEGERSYTLKGSQLNELLATWRITPGATITIDFEVFAVSTGPKYQMPEVSKVAFNASGYDINNYLTIIITRDGSEIEEEMLEVAVSSDKFSWTGDIREGDKIRFVRDVMDGTWPAFVKEQDGTLTAKSEGEGADAQIQIGKWNMDGEYLTTILVDMNDQSYTYKTFYKIPGETMYIVGGAVAPLDGVNWSPDWSKILSQPDPISEPWIWTFTGRFTYSGPGVAPSTFRILFQQNWDPSIRPPFDYANPFEKVKGVYGPDRGGDYRWIVPEGTNGTYTVTVDLSDVSLVMSDGPYVDTSNHLYAIVSRGLQEPMIYEMTEDPVDSDKFVWKNAVMGLRVGDKLRFGRSSMYTWPAYVKGETDGSLVLKDVADGSADQIEITGTYYNEYEIAVDMTTSTYTLPDNITPYFVTPHEMISVVGDAVGTDWDPNAARANCPMVQDADEPWIWTYYGRFTSDGADQDAFTLIMAKDANQWDPRLGSSNAAGFMDPFTPAGQEIVYYGTEGGKWKLPADTDGFYTLTADLKEMKLTLVKDETVILEPLFIVITRGGEEIVRPMVEEVIGSQQFVLTFNDMKTDDKIRFSRSATETWPAYVKGATAGTLKLANDETAGGADQIVIDHDFHKDHPVNVNINALTWSITEPVPFNPPNGTLCLVGDAVEAGWDPSQSLAICSLTQLDAANRPWIWTYTGPFTGDGVVPSGSEDAFQIILNAPNWDQRLGGTGGDGSYMDPFTPEGQVMQYYATEGGKWRIPVNKSGRYTLTVDLREMWITLTPAE